jgi:DNA-binding CsgD family transcriptional regulator
MTTCPNCQFTTSSLSPKEARTLELLFTGMTTADIAETICNTQKTVWTYRERAMRKLGVSNIFEAYRKWVTLRMIDAPDIDGTADYRCGYSQALADALSPDLRLFENRD